VSALTAGFVATSRAFKSYYGGFQAYFDEEESRIKRLYDYLQLGIKPWEWDYETYSKDPEMIGFFYQEDIENIRQIDEFERKRRR
jgi:hypothetical protein